MKKQISFLTLLVSVILCGCNHSTQPFIFNKVKNLMQSNPDSAYSLLATINTDTLNAGNFAHWCMLKAELSHRASNVSVPSIEEMKTAYDWFQKHCKSKEQLKSEFYLGMAYAHEGETDKAMDTYSHVYHAAERSQNYQLMGYTCSYMADLYFDYEYTSKSVDKKKEAAFWFKKANNPRSYTCALRDICMNYTAIDSLSQAFYYLQKADSIGKTLNDTNVYESILNAYGNLYRRKGEYKLAENYFYQALALNKNSISNYFALASLYIETNQFQKAKDILKKIPMDKNIHRYAVYSDLYEIAKLEGKFEQAFYYLEQYTDINDSLTAASNESKIFEIENRYKHQKLMTENAELKLQQRNYLLIIAICLIGVLILLGIYWNYRKRTEKRLLLQQADIRETRNQMLELSIEIERKNALLERSETEQQALQRLQQEKKELTAHYHTLRQNMLQSSVYLFGFDTNDETTLLGINTTSVRTKTARLRTRLHIELSEKSSLYSFLTTQI